MVKVLSVDELHEDFMCFFVIDVREEDEFEAEYIEHVISLPLSDPSNIVENATKPLVFMCRSGARSLIAAQRHLIKNPSETVYNLSGGILAWRGRGYPVISD